MDRREQLDSVIRFYETHPINEHEILQKLRADGVDLATLTEETLKDYDQDHFGGLEAVDLLAEKAGSRTPPTSSTCAAAWAGRPAISRIASAAGSPGWTSP